MPWMGRPVVGLLSAGLVCAAIGCDGGSEAVPYPSLDAAGATSRLFAAADSDKNGQLDAKELARAPSILAALKSWDRNGDGQVGRAEATAGFQHHVDELSPLVQPPTRFTFGGAPLADVEIRLIPEPFLGPGFHPAVGTTDARGYASFVSEGEPLPGVRCGLYRIEASRKSGGKETLPPRCNVQTTYGLDLRLGTSQGISIEMK